MIRFITLLEKKETHFSFTASLNINEASSFRSILMQYKSPLLINAVTLALCSLEFEFIISFNTSILSSCRPISASTELKNIIDIDYITRVNSEKFLIFDGQLRRVLSKMVEKYRYRDMEKCIKSFDIQPSKMKLVQGRPIHDSDFFKPSK